MMQSLLRANLLFDNLNKSTIKLEDAMKEIKTLSGLLPICSSGKIIRDKQGKWNQLVIYIKDNSEAEVTHGLYPDCVKKYYT